MKVLIACECSQTVCKEFRFIGHEAYSCDIEPCYGGHPEWHIVGDCTKIIDGNIEFNTQDGAYHTVYKWDLIIAHPPCTYLSNAATSKHSLKSTTLEEINARTAKRIQAQEFFMMIANAKRERIAIENPVGVMSTVYRKPDQIIEPYQFAESENDKENYQTKRTCLWLKGLQPLKINDLPRPDIKAIYGTWSNGKARCWHERVSTDKARVRSKTFPGIARAMAEQLGDILRWRRKAGNIMSKYRVSAYINFEDVLELDEKDFENEEEMNEEIYSYVASFIDYSYNKVEE